MGQNINGGLANTLEGVSGELYFFLFFFMFSLIFLLGMYVHTKE